VNPSGSTLKRDLFNFSKIFQLKDKISEDDKKKVLDKCQETLSWLDANQTADMRRKNLSIIKRNWKLFAIRSFRSLTALTSSNQWMIGFDFEGIKAGIRCLGVALFGQAWVVCSIPFILSFRFFFFSFLSFIAFRSSLVKNFFLLFETFEGFLSCSRNKGIRSHHSLSFEYSFVSSAKRFMIPKMIVFFNFTFYKHTNF